MGSRYGSRYGQNLFDKIKKLTTDALYNTSIWAMHKTAEQTGDLENKVAEKIKMASSKSANTTTNKLT